MYWQENESRQRFQVPDDIVDFAYRIDCPTLPLEHAYALSRALHEALPWLADEERAGVHLIHGAESGNGWMRPQDPENELLHLSRRTRMTLRLPKERVPDAQALTGRTLDIDGYPLRVGEGSVKLLSASATIFSRYVVDEQAAGEQAFIHSVAEQLQQAGIKVRKMMCGRTHLLKTPDADILTRSIMVADLDKPDAVRIQELGVGPHRKLGCGLFLAHKGIDPVASVDDE